MARRPFAPRVLLPLIVAGLVLPMIVCVVMGLAALLTAMSDTVGAAVLRYVALAGGIGWVLVLVSLVLLQAILMFDRSDEDDS